MRAFSSFPPFNARAPGILPTNSDATCLAFSSSLHTRTSQSTGASPASTSAPRFWNAAAKLTPAGKSSFVCSAAEPCQTPSTRVAAPPTVAASGAVVSITIVPGFHTLFNCFSSPAAPEKGTVKIAISQTAAAEGLSLPSICAPPTRSRNCFAVSCARAASREPIKMHSPAFASRYASPVPSGPVPPRIAIVRAISVHPVSHPAAHSNRRRIRDSNRRHDIFRSNPLLRFSRTQYGIFKNFQDANVVTLVIQIPQSPGPFRHRRDRRYRRARTRQDPRHDRQLVLFGLAPSHAHSDLRGSWRENARAAAKEKAVRREHPETKSAGHLRILRETRTQRRSGAAAGHPLSAEARRRSDPRWHTSADEVQGDCRAFGRRPYGFYWESGGCGNRGRRAAALLSR